MKPYRKSPRCSCRRKACSANVEGGLSTDAACGYMDFHVYAGAPNPTPHEMWSSRYRPATKEGKPLYRVVKANPELGERCLKVGHHVVDPLPASGCWSLTCVRGSGPPGTPNEVDGDNCVRAFVQTNTRRRCRRPIYSLQLWG